jgi:hypothetical protein
MKGFFATALALAFVLAACTDSANKTDNFNTQAEAEAAVAQNEATIGLAVELALLAVQQTGFDGSFTGGVPLFKNSTGKRTRFNRPMDDTTTYNSTTGWWTYEEHETEVEEDGTYNLDVLFQLRFTPRDLIGLPTDATDQMEYVADVDWDFDGTDGDFIFSYLSELVFTGLAAFNDTTGDAVMNGSTDFDWEITSGAGQQSFSFEYTYDIDYNSVAFANGADYPQSGSVDFVVRLNITPNIEGFDEYNVAGTITFDGDNTATLVFGGWNFVINLDTGDITPA